MNKNKSWVVARSVLLVVMAVFLLWIRPGNVRAATAKTAYRLCTSGKEYVVGGKTFRCKAQSIQMKESGRWKTLISRAHSDYVTNGSFIVYARTDSTTRDRWGNTAHRNTVYRYNIKTKQSRKLATGINYEALGASSAHVYIGEAVVGEGYTIYAYGLNSRKLRKMCDNGASVNVGCKRVLVSPSHSDPGDKPVYTFLFDGRDRRKICVARQAKLVSKTRTVYYLVSSGIMVRVYQCSDMGANKKPLTQWMPINKVPAKYR